MTEQERAMKVELLRTLRELVEVIKEIQEVHEELFQAIRDFGKELKL